MRVVTPAAHGHIRQCEACPPPNRPHPRQPALGLVLLLLLVRPDISLYINAHTHPYEYAYAYVRLHIYVYTYDISPSQSRLGVLKGPPGSWLTMTQPHWGARNYTPPQAKNKMFFLLGHGGGV